MNYLDQYNSTAFITGLRGYSVLAVFLIHSGGGGLRELSYFTNEIVDKGKYGVVSFFVISAFTIAMSIDKSISKDQFSYKHYIMNRWLRIFPLFFIVALFAFLNGGNSYYLQMFNVNNDIVNFILQISLLNVFFTKHINNLIGVEWMLPIQFFYYLIYPIIFIILSSIMKNNKILYALFIVITLSISFFSNWIISPFYSNPFATISSSSNFGQLLISEFFNPEYRGLSNHWGLLKYLFTFISGFTVYFVFTNKSFITLVANAPKPISNMIFVTILVVGFIIVTVWKHNVDFVVTAFISCLLLSSFYRGLPVIVFFKITFRLKQFFEFGLGY
jgi:peptidoglycan/LPS O-acetylase OafA/YrhL